MKNMLKKHYNYLDENITVLTDDTDIKPTKMDIIKAFYTISHQTVTKNINECFIHYSGHGSHLPDYSGDEQDKQDECIIPLDYSKNGVITDDLINDIFSKINKETRCISIFDCCHAGTICDLQYTYVGGVKSVIENDKNNTVANIITLSGCLDNQTSADAYNLENQKKYSGALSTSILHTLKENNYDITCFNLIKKLLNYMKDNHFTQIPQITTSRKITQTTIFSKNSTDNFYLETKKSS